MIWYNYSDLGANHTLETMPINNRLKTVLCQVINWPVFVHRFGRLSNNTRVVALLAPVIILKYGNDTCSNRKSDRRWGSVCHLLGYDLLDIAGFAVWWFKLHFVCNWQGQTSRWSLQNGTRTSTWMWKVNNKFDIVQRLHFNNNLQPNIILRHNLEHKPNYLNA